MALHIIDEANRCMNCKKPMCQQGCPVHTPIPHIIQMFKEHQIMEAGEELFRNNPMSVICSTVCNHEMQCAGHCVLGRKGNPVHFSSIENYISDTYLDRMEVKPEEKKDQKVAVIGAGSAGMTVAMILAQKGYQVTIFEWKDKIGGITRSNIPLMSQYCYHRYAPDFAARAKELGSSIIVGGENYGQGSSREHAAINPMYLGVKCVIAKSIARIHKGNLVNHGIIPMLFDDPSTYEKIDQGDELEIEDLLEQIPTRTVLVKDKTKNFMFQVRLDLTDNEIEVVLSGGQLRYLKKQIAEQNA